MSEDSPESLMGSHNLLSAIESFSESVTQFLLPVVRFVGHKGDLFDDLERRFSGLIHEKRYSEKPAHLVIFDEIPYQYLTSEQPLSADAAYLFCLEENQTLTNDHLKFLENRISLVLTKPTTDEVLWHLKALLIIQDIAYGNGNTLYAPLISADVKFRRCISTLIAASINLDSCMICVGTPTLQNMLVELVFSLHPSVIKPFYCDHDQLDADSLPDERVSIALPNCETATDLKLLGMSVTKALISKPLIVVVVCRDTDQVAVDIPFPVLVLPTLEVRNIDAKLLAYWRSAFETHAYDSPRYYSHTQITDSITISNGNPDSFLDSLANMDPESKTVDDEFFDLIERYDRLSIDDIFNVAEQRVMQNLRDRSTIVDAASNAAGIPKVTFHKRMKRLGEKQTLLSLLSSVQSHD